MRKLHHRKRHFLDWLDWFLWFLFRFSLCWLSWGIQIIVRNNIVSGRINLWRLYCQEKNRFTEKLDCDCGQWTRMLLSRCKVTAINASGSKPEGTSFLPRVSAPSYLKGVLFFHNLQNAAYRMIHKVLYGECGVHDEKREWAARYALPGQQFSESIQDDVYEAVSPDS